MKTPTKEHQMNTCTTIHTQHGYDVTKVEFPDLEIPVHTGPQRQGDVFVLPVTTKHNGNPISVKGVTVVRAESNTANTHNLHGDGTWLWSDTAATNLVQGWLTVPDGGEAYLIHTEEHPALAIGPGTYEIRRQREFAGEWRRVAD